MGVVFGIGMVIWLAGVATMFLARALRERSTQVFRGGLVACGIGSTILAIATPAVGGESGDHDVVMCIVFAGMAVLCAYTALVLRRDAAGPEPKREIGERAPLRE